MAAKRRKAPEARRGDLVRAARKVFGAKGAANAAVSDIVKEAGVAQGTFYLYFDAKDDIINALVEEMVEGMVNAVERTVAATEIGAVSKLLAMRDALVALAGEPAGQELAAIYHRPENRAVHDRMAERFASRLAPLVEEIVNQGVAEGVFIAEDARVSALFILGGLRMQEFGFTDPADLLAAVTTAMVFALRGLGHTLPAPGQG